MDKAPTNPSESAKEDFTTEIIKIVVRVMKGKTLLKSSLFVSVDPNFL